MLPHFTSAKELFESASAASRDAESVRLQLIAMEHRAEGLGGGGFEPRVRSTGEPDRMAGRVAVLVDKEELLYRQCEYDYAIIDYANRVLYGDDMDAGLRSLMGWRARALDLHYLVGLTWAQVGAMLGYSEQYVWQQAQVALDTCDGWGLLSVMAGVGRAEG